MEEPHRQGQRRRQHSNSSSSAPRRGVPEPEVGAPLPARPRAVVERAVAVLLRYLVVVVQVEAARTFGRRGALRAMVKVQVGVEVVVVERRQRRRRMEAVISRSLLRRRGGAHWTLGHAMTALLKWSTSMRTTTRCRRHLLPCTLAGAALFSSRGIP